MKISVASFGERPKADLLIVPFWEGHVDAHRFPMLQPLVSSGDFKGKQGETAFFYPENGSETRLLLLGLGKEEKGSLESIRRAYAAASRAAQAKKVRSANILVPTSAKLSHEQLLIAAAESLFLTNYSFSKLKGDSLKDNPPVLLEQITWIDVEKSSLNHLERAKKIVDGVFFVRNLVNDNADDKTAALKEAASHFAQNHSHVTTEIFDKKRLEQEKMGLILAVNRGSKQEPCLIISSYKGNPASKEHIVLVGKGITYDTGGLNLKVGDGMLTMKSDMAGAATVLGTVQTAASLGLKINVTAVAPVTENGIDGTSYKPGDVYRAYNGKTVEITNTDAEGRLVLGDALSYAAKNLAPSCLIDFATLTGAIVVALGEEVSGFFTDDENLSKDLMKASKQTGELMWRMPIHPDYKDAMKSEIADLVNSGGRDAGSIKGALFLQEFVGKTPWVHIDFAGPTYVSKPKHYNTAKGTGFGVRLMIDFLERRERH
ncbi:MAG: leucyl aminopeptidase [Verrucomicrobia bacterium]|nr:leucyl aminopeptidase [Verrucomicrobiota bacterium]